MIGLYLLLTRQLIKDNTFKFGMSMRLEHRWIDYLMIFKDAKYIYYYEFINDLSRENILELENEILKIIKLKYKRNFYYQTEYFYSTNYDDINQIIINILDKNNINYIVHNKHDFKRSYYDNKPELFTSKKLNINIHKLINVLKYSVKTLNIYTPKLHQMKVLEKIKYFYKFYNIGKLNWCCGLGKTLMALFIIYHLNFKSVIIGVPSINLQKQMKKEIIKIFPNIRNILSIGSNSTTNPKIIDKFINEELEDPKFIITTYSSCHLLANKYKFDFKIGDEGHHLTGSEEKEESETEKKSYNMFHQINSDKTLFMTATEKIIENNKSNKIIYSMNDETLFGKTIDIKTIKWAIYHKMITDYNLIIIKNTYNEISEIMNSLTEFESSIIHNLELFLAAYMTLKSFEKYSDLTHILIYANSTTNAELINEYINIIINKNIINIDKNDIYNKALHSNIKIDLEKELNNFTKSKYGIISCVYIFGEGFDCPDLNGVVIAENMTSDIRIVQSVLRPNRLNKEKQNKIAYIIIPFIEENNESFEKCRKIISKIRNVDEHIEYKINVLSLTKKEIDNESEKEELTKIQYQHLINNEDELSKIKLRLKYSKALDSLLSEEEDEYNYIKQINKEFNIKSKKEYVINRHINYIDNVEEYFKSKGVWVSWLDFLCIDTSKYIQDKNEWINFCKELNIRSLEEYDQMCQIHDNLPRDPTDFYKDFTNILNELKIKNRR